MHFFLDPAQVVDRLRGVHVLYLFASIGNLAIALLIIFRGRQARGALPLALLCSAFFVWDLGQAAAIMSAGPYRLKLSFRPWRTPKGAWKGRVVSREVRFAVEK